MGIGLPQGARRYHDPGLWNVTPLAYRAVGVSGGDWRIDAVGVFDVVPSSTIGECGYR